MKSNYESRGDWRHIHKSQVTKQRNYIINKFKCFSKWCKHLWFFCARLRFGSVFCLYFPWHHYNRLTQFKAINKLNLSLIMVRIFFRSSMYNTHRPINRFGSIEFAKWIQFTHFLLLLSTSMFLLNFLNLESLFIRQY